MQNLTHIVTQTDITLQNIRYFLSKSHFKQITSMQIVPLQVTGAMSQVRKLQLKYRQQDQGFSPSTIFLKFGRNLPPEHWIIKFVKENLTYQHEVQAYSFLMKNTENLIPQIYYIHSDNENQKFTILMEDLTQNYKIIQQKHGVQSNLVYLVMEEMANFHAKNLNILQCQVKFQSYSNFFATCNTFSRVKVITEQLLQKMNKSFQTNIKLALEILKKIDYKNTIYSELQKMVPQINIQNLIKYHKFYFERLIKKQPIQTLLHCDLRCQNMLFNPKNIKVVDWQCTSTGSPLIDIAKFLIQSVSIQTRRKQYDNFLTNKKQYSVVKTLYIRYHQLLFDNLDGCYEQTGTLFKFISKNRKFEIKALRKEQISRINVDYSRKNNCILQ